MQLPDASMLALIAIAVLGLLLMVVLFKLRIAGWRRIWAQHRYTPIPRAGETGIEHRRRSVAMWLWCLVGAGGVLAMSLGVLGGVAGSSDAWPVAARVAAVIVGAGVAGAAILAGARAAAADRRDPFPRDRARQRGDA